MKENKKVELNLKDMENDDSKEHVRSLSSSCSGFHVLLDFPVPCSQTFQMFLRSHALSGMMLHEKLEAFNYSFLHR